jgi:hypothetical protein
MTVAVGTTSLKQIHHSESRDENCFNSFKKMLLTTFEVNAISELPFQKIEYAFDILNSKQDFIFADADERLSNFLVLMACLQSSKSQDKVCFISPTYFYAQQAAVMRIRYLSGFKASEKRFSCVVPGMYEFEGEVNKCTVLFMHGKDYSQYLPKSWEGRKIIQIFPDEKVPVDPIRKSCCSMHDCND